MQDWVLDLNSPMPPHSARRDPQITSKTTWQQERFEGEPLATVGLKQSESNFRSRKAKNMLHELVCGEHVCMQSR